MARASRSAAPIDTILRERIIASADRIVGMMEPAARAEAAKTPDVPSLVLSLVRGLPVSESDDPAIKESIVAAAEFKRRLLTAAGGALTAGQVREIRGHKTVQAVYKAARDRRLLMVDDNGRKLFPAFQFREDVVAPAIEDILNAAPHTDGWRILQFMVSGDRGLGADRPLDLIKGGPEDLRRVVRFAETLED
jgi:hypothetical protein